MDGLYPYIFLISNHKSYSYHIAKLRYASYELMAEQVRIMVIFGPRRAIYGDCSHNKTLVTFRTNTVFRSSKILKDLKKKKKKKSAY